MARIMLLTSTYTGRGHMSIAQAMEEQFSKIPGVQLDTFDAFTFMGSGGVPSSKLYNVVTQHAPLVWKAAFRTSQKEEFLTDTIMGRIIRRRLAECVRRLRPDLILTVHPLFVGSVLNALEQDHISVPVVSIEADLVNIHPSWCDPRVKMAICPTQEARDRSIEFGVPEEKTIVMGFPTRQSFCDAAKAQEPAEYDPARPLNCLLIGGGGGTGDLDDYAEAVLRDTDARLTVICGMNGKLCGQLREKYGGMFGDRLTLRGFVEDIENEYAAADVCLCRAGPNSMFEAVVMAKPMVIIGALPGQEQDNPRFAEDHDLGIICRSPDHVARCLDALTADGGRLFNRIRNSQTAYRDLDTAKKIAEYVLSLI